MATIEERIVSMKFQGEQFLAGIDKSLAKLEQFNQKLKMAEGAKGLEGIGSAAQKQAGSLTKVAENVQHISDRFKAMGVVAMSALNNVTNQAIFAGQNLVKSLTIDPVLKGFREYELNMNSIQTILSNTKAAGTTLKDVTNALDELNRYSDQTIYNFAEMAKNIGTFTAAGVDLKTATASIKGIANLAAMSGTNSERAAGAMYQLSQAISAGRVTLEDWNSVVNAGMGGAVFQRALAQTAVAMGKIDDSALKLTGNMKNVSINGKSFRESIMAKPGQESWLTGDVLTATLKQFTGDLKDAELAAMGFTKSQIAAIQEQAKSAKAAATEVKTLSQLFDTLGESAGSGWSQTWRTIIGDFEEAKTLFTNINNTIGGLVGGESRNKMLEAWSDLGGRKVLIEGLSLAFNNLMEIITPIGKAFRDIFPKTTGQQLYNLTVQFRDFMSSLRLGEDTMDNLRRTFRGVFAAIDIGWMIVKEFVKTIFDLLGVVSDGSGGFLDFTGNIGNFVVKLRDAIKNGDGLRTFFKGLGKVIEVPIRIIKALVGFLGDLSGELNGVDVSKLSPFEKIGALASAGWNKLGEVVGVVWGKIQAFGSWINGFFSKMGFNISNMFEGMNFQDLFAGINTGLFAGIVLMLRNLIGGGGAGGIMESISEGFENLTDSLGAMQNTLRAATLLQIAAAVGILAISMNTLSKIDSAGLARASTAITVMFTQLIGALLIFEKFSGFVGFAKMPFVAASMILLGVAVNVLASAMKKLAELEWEELAKGLTGVTALLAAMVGVTRLVGNPAGLISTAIGMVILAAAVKVLVSAVSDLAGMSWEELSRGLVATGALLGALALFTKFADANKGGLLQGAGLLLLAVGIKIFASAVKDMASLSWEEIGRGLTTMAGSLAIMTAALMLIPPTAPLSAAGVVLVAASLGMVADSLQKLGGMSWGEIGSGLTAMLGALGIITAALFVIPPTAVFSAAGILIVATSLGMIGNALQRFSEFSWEEIGKAMTVLAGSLGIIAIAMTVMTGALPGAAALLVVTASLAIFVPILQTLGAMSWGTILTGLGALALAFTVLGVAGALLTPVIPSLLGLGTAITLLGVGVALTGAGIFLLASGLTLLAASGVAAASALVGMVTIILGALPKIVELIGALLIALLDLIVKAAPKIGQAFTAVMETLIQVISNIAPKIISLILKLLTSLLESLANYVPRMAEAGAKLITGILSGIASRIGGIVTAATNLMVSFLNAIAKNLPRVITAATNVIVAFLKGIGDNLPRILDAGAKLIVSFVNGLANAIRNNTSAMQSAGRNLAMAIVDGMTGGLASGIGKVVSKAKEIAGSALNAAKGILGINSPSKEFEKIGRFVNDGFRKGLDGNRAQVDSAFNNLKKMLSDMSKSSKLSTSERRKAALAYSELTRNLNDERTALGNLANKYDVITAKIKKANETLANAVKVRDDYNKSVSEQYSDTASATGEQTASDYIKGLKKQVEDTKSFANQLQMLRKLGLNDETYKDLVATGISALPFVTDLLKGGKTQVDQINALNKEVDSLGTAMGKTASSALYQAAVNSASGLVKGLQSQQAAIEKQMDIIADAMVKAIKSKLGIRSPSRVFAMLGRYSAQGLTKGLENSTVMVSGSAAKVGRAALEAMRVSLSDVDKMAAGNIDVRPTIRPVLDLTDIKKNAGKLDGLLRERNKMTIDGVSYNNAASAANEIRNRFDGEEFDGAAGGVQLNYVQNITSPKPVSAVEVYRGTKNQLSSVKGALST